MRLLSFLPPVTSDHVGGHLGQSITLGWRKVGFLVFGKNCQNKHGEPVSTEQIDYTCAAALAPRAEAKPHLRIPPLPGMITPHVGSAARRSTTARRSSGENSRSASAR